MKFQACFTIVILIVLTSCDSREREPGTIITVDGVQQIDTSKIWLTHEHIMVDFIGADSINPKDWKHDEVVEKMLPFLLEASRRNVDYFVDATPNYLGRDVALLQKMATKAGVEILTNTGLYAAVDHKYIPAFAKDLSAIELAEMWIDEFENGIDGTTIKPGFIKISVNNTDPLKQMDRKVVEAAALTHIKTGLVIASHTGKAKGLWPQMSILENAGVSPTAFIWVHAQAETDDENFLAAAKAGCWISLDGLGWETDDHVKKLLLAKENGFLDRVLISHDAGWFDPQKSEQSVQPYTNLFDNVIPRLREAGFTNHDINTLIKYNPARAFRIEIRVAE